MIYIVAAILLSTSILIFFRYFRKLEIDNLQAIVVNYIIAAVIGFTAYDGEVGPNELSKAGWFPVAVVLGILFIGVFFLFAMSSQKAGVAVTAVASRMSVVIPVAGGLVLFGDQVGLIKAIGLIMALLAIYFILRKEGAAPFNLSSFGMPLLIFIGAGTNDLLMKYAEYHFLKDDLMLFLATIFSLAFIIGSFVLLFHMITKGVKIKCKNIFVGIILGLVNFGSTYFLIRSMNLFESSMLFPVVNAGVVSLAALADNILFHEKFSLFNLIGIGLAIVSIIMISAG